MYNTVEILNGLNAGSEIEIDTKKAAEALVNGYIVINNNEYKEVGRFHFYPNIVIHYEYNDKYGNTSKIRANISIISLINNSFDSYTDELIDRLLAKSFDGLGIPRKKIAKYLGIRQSTLSYILNKSMFRHRKIKN